MSFLPARCESMSGRPQMHHAGLATLRRVEVPETQRAFVLQILKFCFSHVVFRFFTVAFLSGQSQRPLRLQDHRHPALLAVEFKTAGMMGILQFERLLNRVGVSLQFRTEVQLIPNTVSGSHDRFAGNIGKGLKGQLCNGCTVALIEFPCMVVQDIGMEIEALSPDTGYHWDGRVSPAEYRRFAEPSKVSPEPRAGCR